MSLYHRRLTFVIPGLVILSLLLSACAPSQSPRLTVPAGAKAGDLKTQPCSFKTDQGAYDADCGTLIVPENRSRSDSRLIALPVTRIHATQDDPAEPIFWLEGGPGSSNMTFKPPAWMLSRHDVVMVGYRGMDGTTLLDCPEYTQALAGNGVSILSQESLDKLGNAASQCAQRLQADGIDLDGYTIPEVIEDMEAARTGLGYESVNLYSVSYGTRIALLYEYKHPKSLHRVIMAGVNPPGRFVWEPDTIDEQIEYYASLCAKDAGCSARTTDLAETVRNVSHNMPKNWLFLPIDPGKAQAAAFGALFNRGSAAMVFDTYLAAEQGDPSGMALASLMFDMAYAPLITWGDLIAKGGSADYDPQRDYIQEMNPPGSIMGSPLGVLIWGSIEDDRWPIHLIPEDLRRVRTSDVETLLLGGSVDFTTPSQNATRDLLPYLSRGKQIILAEMGHNDMTNLQPAAFERLMTSFYDTGVADDSLYTYVPMDFHVSMGFPLIAKLALAGLLLVIVLLAFLVWLVIRKIQKRRMLQ